MTVNPWSVGALLLLGGVACQPEVTCPANGVPCGGDPSGTWRVANACRDPIFEPPLPTTYLGQPVEMARQPRPMMTSSDWCSSIFIGNGGVTSFVFPHDTLSPSGGQITYVSDDPQQQQGTYEAVIDTSGRGGVDLSPACLQRSGATIASCDAVAAALTTFAATKLADPGVPCTDGLGQPSQCQFYFSYQNISCAGSPDAGCRCAYDVSFAGALKGRWVRSGSVLTHSDLSKMLPSQADYCVANGGTSLNLWGHDRTSLLNQSGMRSLQLEKP